MDKKEVKKFLKRRLPVLGTWTLLCFVAVVFCLELWFFTSHNYEVVDGAYRDTVVRSAIIEKQDELIEAQDEYIQDLKANNKVLAARLEASEAENAALMNDILATFGPLLDQLGYRIAFVGGCAFVQKDDGTFGLK